MSNYRMKLVRDDDPISPDFWGRDESFLVVNQRFFATDRRGEDPYELIEKGYKLFPVFALVHSGIVLSVSPFNDPWDSGQVGWVAVEEAKFTDAEEAAKAEVDEWNTFLSGDVWGVIVERVEMCSLGHEHAEEVESCWGIYGEENAKEEGERMLAAYTNEQVIS